MIVQHPSAPVTFEPYPPDLIARDPERIITAQKAAIAELQKAVQLLTHVPAEPMELVTDPPSTEDEFARWEATEMIRVIAERYTYARVARWVRNLAHVHGEEV